MCHRGLKYKLKCLADLGPIFGQTWARDRCQRLRLEKCCINQRKVARETGSTVGFLIHDFWAGRESTFFGVWAAPGARDTIPKCGAAGHQGSMWLYRGVLIIRPGRPGSFAVLGRFRAKLGPGTVANGFGLKNAA